MEGALVVGGAWVMGGVWVVGGALVVRGDDVNIFGMIVPGDGVCGLIATKILYTKFMYRS